MPRCYQRDIGGEGASVLKQLQVAHKLLERKVENARMKLSKTLNQWEPGENAKKDRRDKQNVLIDLQDEIELSRMAQERSVLLPL